MKLDALIIHWGFPVGNIFSEILGFDGEQSYERNDQSLRVTRF